MQYHLIKNPINFQYSIFNSKIELFPQFKDLGIICTYSKLLNFSSQELSRIKLFVTWVLFNALVVHSMDPIPLKIIYGSLVRSDLEYCPLTWVNNTSKQNESVQNRFLRYVSFKFFIHKPLHGSYNNVLKCPNISLFSNRRTLLLSKFFLKLLLGSIGCPKILPLIRFKAFSQPRVSYVPFRARDFLFLLFLKSLYFFSLFFLIFTSSKSFSLYTTYS